MRELAPATRGSQDAGSRNLGFTFHLCVELCLLQRLLLLLLLRSVPSVSGSILAHLLHLLVASLSQYEYISHYVRGILTLGTQIKEDARPENVNILGMTKNLSPDFSAPKSNFGCCTADLQADKDRNQLNNNLKIDFGAPKSGDSYELMKELHQSPTDLKSGLRRWPFLLCHYCNFIMVYFILSH